jgi:hypothetical protein
MLSGADVRCTCQVEQAEAVTGRIVDQLAPGGTEPAHTEPVGVAVGGDREQQDAHHGNADLADAPAASKAKAMRGPVGLGKQRKVSTTAGHSLC